MADQATWAICPFIDNVEMTQQAVLDLLAQTSSCRVLLIDQGSSTATGDVMRLFVERHHPQVLLWTFVPMLPSLSGAWNRALQFVWELGHTEAWVVNNDIQLWRDTLAVLKGQLEIYDPLFVSAVGVREPDWHLELYAWSDDRGGPDFSCFLITKAGHTRYPFDEGFIPAFGEDCSNHREYMLGGDASRIYSINLPFLHIGGGSRTINQSPEARARFERVAQIGRAHYVASWGGPPNQERYVRKGDPSSARDGVTNPELQAAGGLVAEEEVGEPEQGDGEGDHG